jgi:hypothetical protein
MSSRDKGILIGGAIMFVLMVGPAIITQSDNILFNIMVWVGFMFYIDLRYSSEEMKETLKKIHSELESMRRDASGNF